MGERQLDFTCDVCSRWFCSDPECQARLNKRQRELSQPSRTKEKRNAASKRYKAKHGDKTSAVRYARYIAKHDRRPYWNKRYEEKKASRDLALNDPATATQAR